MTGGFLEYISSYISSLIPEGRMKRGLKRIYFRYLNNEWYRLNSIIKRTEILEDGLIYVELKDGVVFYDNKSRFDQEDQAYKWAIKGKVTNIKNPNEYPQVYRRIYHELFYCFRL